MATESVDRSGFDNGANAAAPRLMSRCTRRRALPAVARIEPASRYCARLDYLLRAF